MITIPAPRAKSGPQGSPTADSDTARYRVDHNLGEASWSRCTSSFTLDNPISGVHPVPEETARVARAAFPHGSPYLTCRDALGTIFQAGVPLDAYPVSRMVNKPSVDGKELIRPIE